MKGTVVQFRRGNRTLTEKHFTLNFDCKNRAEAMKLIGKEVVWTSTGKEPKKISGKISSAHGNKGLVRAIFERGLPGQALTTEIEMKENSGGKK
ncbi:MAG: 50S ribosomal protein L35ae [Nanoarchaeota archaeon]